VLPVDADDELERPFLAATVGAMEATPSADCVFTDFQLFGDRSAVWQWKVGDLEAMVSEQWIPGPGTVMRRSLWERVGGYCEDAVFRWGNEDWDFWIGAMETGCRPLRIAEPLYRYRRHHETMSPRLALNNHVTREAIVRRHPAAFPTATSGRRFLASGYRIAAEASFRNRQPLRGGRLAARAAVLDPSAWPALAPLVRAAASSARPRRGAAREGYVVD
jgi:hypothetical protein